MDQLNLFTNIQCHVCGQNPGADPGNPHLWHGFFDADTGQYVCDKLQCRVQHYDQKQDPGSTGLTYSEMPVPLEGWNRFKTGKR